MGSLLLLPQRRHEAPLRSGERAVVVDIKYGFSGFSLATERQLLSTALVGAVLDIAHEGEIGAAAGAQLKNDGPICVGVCSRHT